MAAGMAAVTTAVLTMAAAAASTMAACTMVDAGTADAAGTDAAGTADAAGMDAADIAGAAITLRAARAGDGVEAGADIGGTATGIGGAAPTTMATMAMAAAATGIAGPLGLALATAGPMPGTSVTDTASAGLQGAACAALFSFPATFFGRTRPNFPQKLQIWRYFKSGLDFDTNRIWILTDSRLLLHGR